MDIVVFPCKVTDEHLGKFSVLDNVVDRFVTTKKSTEELAMRNELELEYKVLV
jgi:hypothetical protein